MSFLQRQSSMEQQDIWFVPYVLWFFFLGILSFILFLIRGSNSNGKWEPPPNWPSPFSSSHALQVGVEGFCMPCWQLWRIQCNAHYYLCRMQCIACCYLWRMQCNVMWGTSPFCHFTSLYPFFAPFMCVHSVSMLQMWGVWPSSGQGTMKGSQGDMSTKWGIF